MSDEDFPAAHSMDTEWFAVDKDGHVARFMTGEAGAAPESSLENYGDPVSVEDLMRMLGDKIEYDVEDLVAMEGGPVFDYAWQTQRYEPATFSDVDSCYYVLIKLPQVITNPQASLKIEQALLERATSSVTINRLPNSKHILGFAEGPVPVGTLQAWVEDGLVEKVWVNHRLSTTRIGIYEYEHGHMFENWISGPYMRESAPTRPLTIDQLPPSLQEMMASTRFDKRSFATDVAIDPREAGECMSWENSWVGFDGIVHRPDDELVEDEPDFDDAEEN